MSSSPALLFLAGSARAGSFNKRLARAAAAEADRQGHRTTLIDLADYPLPLYDGDAEAASGVPAPARALLTVFQAHPGVFVASPEYNASIPPLLKNTFDWLSRLRGPDADGLAMFRSRVFALGAASPSGTGGLRGLIAVRYTLEMGLSAVVLPDQVLVPRAAAAFADDGSLTDADARSRLAAVVARLADVAGRLDG